MNLIHIYIFFVSAVAQVIRQYFHVRIMDRPKAVLSCPVLSSFAGYIRVLEKQESYGF